MSRGSDAGAGPGVDSVADPGVTAAVDPASGPRLRAHEVTIRRGGRTVLTDFSWDRRPGRIGWVVGENGAGKSSLLAVLAGRRPPAAGRVRHDGAGGRPRVLYYRPALRLPSTATVGGWRRAVAALLPPETSAPTGPLAPTGLPAGRRVDRLSTGQAKRLLLDALLMRPAPFIVLDEPYEHLSSGARATLTRLLVQRARTAVVVVATNQPPPGGRAHGPTVRVDGRRARVVA